MAGRSGKKGKLTFEPFNLPLEVAEKCVNLVKTLGLRYGAIDIVVKKDIYYFLEINPNGQWAFVDEYNVTLIGKEIAMLLQN